MDYERLRILDGDDAPTRADKQHIAASLLRLRAGLDAHFTEARHGAGEEPTRGVRIATWNLREFAERNKLGRRLDDAYWYIAEIIRRFDLVALQEVRGDLGALHRVLAHLGDGWDFLATDVTDGGPGNGERMVFLYDAGRIAFRGVAGELTLAHGRELLDARGVELSSEKTLELRFGRRHDLRLPEGVATRVRDGELQTAEVTYVELPKGAHLQLPPGTRLRVPAGKPLFPVGAGLGLGRKSRWLVDEDERIQIPRPVRADGVLQFARTPYYVAFRVGALKLVLCTVHIYYGDEGSRSPGMQRRIAEIERLTDLLADRARSERDSLFIALGDFNIVGREHHTMAVLARRGFVIPAAIREIPEGTNVDRKKFYDQIAYHHPRGAVQTQMRPVAAGVFDFFEHVYRDRARHPDDHDETHLAPKMAAEQAASGSRASPWSFATWRTYQMSDHLPMWVELEADFGDEVLRAMVEGE